MSKKIQRKAQMKDPKSSVAQKKAAKAEAEKNRTYAMRLVGCLIGAILAYFLLAFVEAYLMNIPVKWDKNVLFALAVFLINAFLDYQRVFRS